MAEIGSIKVNVNDLVKEQLTVKIRATGMKEFRFRVWLASKIFRLAGWILGGKCQIEIDAGNY